MPKRLPASLLALGLVVVCWSSAALPQVARDPRVAKLKTLIEQVKPLHKPLGKPEPGDWLIDHKEKGQTFAEYLQARPVTPNGARNVIYVTPLGDLTDSQRKVVNLAAEFMSRYYDRKVKVLGDMPLSVIPDSARRKHPIVGNDQILTTYVLNDLLKPALPYDAAASIALTATDLWPGPGWNFVFGQASLSDRVGVWSINRNGDPDDSEEAFRLCLLRAMKVATHETGHMFTMQHCTKYECNMCGSNNREESDRRPVEVCPECVAKICWATGCDPAARFRKLADFCREQKLETEQKFYEKSLEAVTAKPAAK